MSEEEESALNPKLRSALNPMLLDVDKDIVNEFLDTLPQTKAPFQSQTFRNIGDIKKKITFQKKHAFELADSSKYRNPEFEFQDPSSRSTAELKNSLEHEMRKLDEVDRAATVQRLVRQATLKIMECEKAKAEAEELQQMSDEPSRFSFQSPAYSVENAPLVRQDSKSYLPTKLPFQSPTHSHEFIRQVSQSSPIAIEADTSPENVFGSPKALMRQGEPCQSPKLQLKIGYQSPKLASGESDYQSPKLASGESLENKIQRIGLRSPLTLQSVNE